MQKRHVTICFVLLFIACALFLMRPIIFPCLISIITAYLLNPLVIKLEEYKIPRLYSVISIILILLIVFILIITLAIPIIYIQITAILNFLVNKIPVLKPNIIPPLLEFLNIKIDQNLLDHLSKNLTENYSDYLAYFLNALKIASSFMIQALSSSFNLVYIISLMVITPVIFFHTLHDLPLIIEKSNNLIPIPYREKVANYFSKIDFIIFNYLKGQVNVCIAMMIFYSIGLSILGLKHPIIIGILSGALTFIPYIGALLYSSIGFLSAVTQFHGWFESVAVLLLFLTGQVIDSNILGPLLIGKKVHIHPAVIIIGITVCASYFGFIGILLFIPIVAVFSVSMEFTIDRYRKSEFYKEG